MPDVSGFQNLEKYLAIFLLLYVAKQSTVWGPHAETIQVFEDILSDLPVVEIHQFANKICSGITIPGDPFNI